MKTITKIEKIYTFEELSENAKKRAMEEFRVSWVESCDYCFYEMFKDKLKNNGLSQLKPYFSLNYCQGDGCCVEGGISIKEVLDKNKCIREQFSNAEVRRLYYIDKHLYYNLEVKHDGCYYHAYSMNFDSDVENYDWVRDGELLNEVIKKLENIIKKYLQQFCEDMKEVGYRMIEDEEGLREYLENSEFEFYADGSVC